MANSIALFKNYIGLLDEVYKQASKTAVLESNGAVVRAGANANEVIIPKISMDGLGDYSRNGGYTNGDVTITHETVAYDYDRARMFTVDSLDVEECGVAFGTLSSEFIRTKVVPELDAMRFAKLAGTTGIGSATGTITTGADAITALRTAVTAMDNAEVGEDRVLFVTPIVKGLIDDLDTTKSREIISRFSEIVIVPQSRFYTAIDLADGKTSGETAGGYKKATGGKDINFMIVEKSACIQFTKHAVTKAISPEENQTADGWKFAFRCAAVEQVYDNKVAGVYVHHLA